MARRQRQTPAAFGEGAILLAGRSELLQDDATGLFYRMRDATLVEGYIRWTGQGLN